MPATITVLIETKENNETVAHLKLHTEDATDFEHRLAWTMYNIMQLIGHNNKNFSEPRGELMMPLWRLIVHFMIQHGRNLWRTDN